MTQLTVAALCCAVYLVPYVRSQSTTSGQKLPEASDVKLRHIAEPPELAGEPGPAPPPPSPASLKFVDSKAIRAATPHDPKTLPPAIQELTGLIRLEPTNSDFYLLRASLSCFARTNSTQVLDDISRAISLHQQSKSTAYSTLREHYALKAKVEFESGHLEESLRDLDQFRRIYPEYDAVPDDVLCERLRALFFPAMKYADFAKQFLIEAKNFKSTVVPALYLKRGDAYAAMKQMRKANIEYDHVLHGFPEAVAYSFVEVNGKRVRKKE